MPSSIAALPSMPERIVGAADHRGSEVKEYLVRIMRESGVKLVAFGNRRPELDNDYSDFIAPWARADGWRSKRIDFTLLFYSQGEIPQWLTNGCIAYSRSMRSKHFSPSQNQMPAGAPRSAAPVRLRQNHRLSL